VFDKRCKKYFLRFKTSSTKIIAKLIYKYVPKCMQYKLPKKYRKPCKFKTKNLLNYSTVPIEKIEHIKNIGKYKSDRYVYNIEVKDNHNYFVGSGILVGNCHHTSQNVLGEILKNALMRLTV